MGTDQTAEKRRRLAWCTLRIDNGVSFSLDRCQQVWPFFSRNWLATWKQPGRRNIFITSGRLASANHSTIQVYDGGYRFEKQTARVSYGSDFCWEEVRHSFVAASCISLVEAHLSVTNNSAFEWKRLLKMQCALFIGDCILLWPRKMFSSKSIPCTWAWTNVFTNYLRVICVLPNVLHTKLVNCFSFVCLFVWIISFGQ